MSIDIRLPNISGTDHEKVEQIRSYLYQFAEQMNWALNNLDSTVSTAVSQATKTPSVAGAEAERQNNFSSIKALIIKSADIVNAYYEEINRRLEGIYVAESEFGTYTETTSQAISESSKEIERLFTNIQEIVSNIDGIENTLIEANAHINSGLLYYDANGVPVYGLEIGQRNTVDGEEVFNKYARFTSDRLSFYDQNDTEVAYISDYKLYITKEEITGSLKIGGFVLDATYGLTLKWEGVTE